MIRFFGNWLRSKLGVFPEPDNLARAPKQILDSDFRQSPSLGPFPILNRGGTYYAAFEHRGANLKLSGSSYDAVFDTLLQLKAITLSNEEVLSKLTAIEVLRLTELWSTRLTERPARRPEVDGNLLLYGLAFYGIKGRPNGWQVSAFPDSEPWKQPLQLTEFGSRICQDLYWGVDLDLPKNNHRDGDKYALQWGNKIGNLHWKFHGPLRARYLEDREMTPEVYAEFDPSHWWGNKTLREVDWGPLHDALERLSLEFPSFMPQLYSWHRIELARRMALFP